jgi:integrase
MRAMLTLAAFAGLRCAEIARLHREDVLDTAAGDRRRARIEARRSGRLVPVDLAAVGGIEGADVSRRVRGHEFERGAARPPAQSAGS